jgi:hypothetical protein
VGGGQFVLFQRCYTRHGRHDFVTGHGDLGPTVFLDCLAEETHADIGPHHRWACGQLYDNVRGGQIHVQDRGRSGTGHGWAGNAQVFWNCAADSLLCQKAWIPSAQNWAIGCIGRKGKPALPGRPDGWWESFGQTVAPRSLYLAQLSERIQRAGGDAEAALRAVTTPEQRQGSLWANLRQRYGADRGQCRAAAPFPAARIFHKASFLFYAFWTLRSHWCRHFPAHGWVAGRPRCGGCACGSAPKTSDAAPPRGISGGTNGSDEGLADVSPGDGSRGVGAIAPRPAEPNAPRLVGAAGGGLGGSAVADCINTAQLIEVP